MDVTENDGIECLLPPRAFPAFIFSALNLLWEWVLLIGLMFGFWLVLWPSLNMAAERDTQNIQSWIYQHLICQIFHQAILTNVQ